MNVRIESPGPCRRELHIEVPAEKVRAAFDEIASAYAKQARIPGFRPGKAPRDLVCRKFQKEIRDDVKEQLVPQAYREAVLKEKIQTVAVLDVREKDLHEDQPFAFTVVVDVQPDFVLPGYKGMQVKAEAVQVADADVDNVLASIRDQNARFEDATRPVEAGDLVKIDFSGTIDGRGVEEIAPGAKGLGESKDFWLMADAENEFLPGFSKALLGAAIGEERTVEVTFPAEFGEKQLAGRQAVYCATVTGVRRKVLPELDDAFLKSLSMDSVDALKARVREDLVRMREQNEKRRQQNEIARLLLEQTTLELPESTVQEETRNEVYDLVRQSQSRGVAREEIENRREEIFEAAAKTAADKVKLRYILRRIAREEKIDVTEQEVEVRIAGLARSWGMPPERVKADLEKKNGMQRVRDDVLLSKTLEWVHGKASIAA